MEKAVIYARVSSKEQKIEGYSIQSQFELLRKYAIDKKIKVIKEFEDNETAKKAGRTSFNQMLQFLKKNKDIDTILVEKTDRLYRNFKDYVQLEDYNLKVHLVKEGTVLSEDSRSHEKFIHGIKVLMAKNYIDNLSEEVKKGQAQKVKEGYVINRPPYGYKKKDQNNKNDSVIDEEKALLVRRAFELYSEGNISLSGVCKKLYEEGFVYNKSNPKIYVSRLDKMLKCHFYYGMIEYKGDLFEGKHKPLISKDLFSKVQLAFKKDNKPQYSKPQNFLFAGAIKCLNCGCIISGEIKKGKYIYYSCSGGKGECSQQHLYIREEKLEEQVISALKEIHISQEHKDWVIKTLKHSFKDEQKFTQERINSLKKQHDILKDRIKKIYIEKLDGRITEEFWKENHNQWVEEKNDIENKLNAYEKTSINFMEESSKFLKICNEINDLFLFAEKEEKKELMNYVLQNFSLEGENLHYDYKKPFDFFVKGLNCLEKLGRKDSNL